MKKGLFVCVLILICVNKTSNASTMLTQEEKNAIYFACRGGKEYYQHGDEKSAKICIQTMQTLERIIEKKDC